MDEIIQASGESLVVVTSIGHVYILSSTAIESGSPLDECIQSSDQIKAEPRLTCVAVWNSNNRKQKKEKKLAIANEITPVTAAKKTDVTVETEMKKNKNKKNKKRKIEQLSS